MKKISTFEAGEGDPRFDRAIEFVEAYRAAMSKMVDETDAMELSVAQSAACMFAGTIFGTMIVAGIAHEADKRRAGEVMLSAFREGIKVGKRRAMRLIPTEGAA